MSNFHHLDHRPRAFDHHPPLSAVMLAHTAVPIAVIHAEPCPLPARRVWQTREERITTRRAKEELENVARAKMLEAKEMERQLRLKTQELESAAALAALAAGAATKAAKDAARAAEDAACAERELDDSELGHASSIEIEDDFEACSIDELPEDEDSSDFMSAISLIDEKRASQSDDEAIIDVHFVRKVGSPDFLKDSIFACVASGEVTCQDCG